MSGPVEAHDTMAEDDSSIVKVEVREGRRAEVGGLEIARVLPTKGRRTVGPWCFIDLMTPPDVDQPDPMEVGPHPHIGLSTATWLFSGEAEHSDSLGTKQLIRPGELNLMSAGNGIAHAEQGLGRRLHGAQMWIAQPEATRHGASGFEHHADLPQVDLDTGTGTVIIGSFGGSTSPARTDWGTMGVDLDVRAGLLEVEIAAGHEHAVVPIDQPVLVEDAVVEPGSLALLPTGLEGFRLETRADRARILVIGGEPLGERVQMWWNFVARTRDEIIEAWKAWNDGDEDRFGPVPTRIERIEAPRPPWIR
jgi:redox-sensitive bicupin YhaK (pirin superfamily)